MRRREWIIALGLALVAFVMRVAFRYVDGFGDNNVIHMASGMARSMAFDGSFGDSLQYGKNFSLGVYLGFRGLYPLFFDGPAMVVRALNWTGIVGSSLLYAALYAAYRPSLSPKAAAFACLLMICTPVAWENETYFQPVTLALAWLLVAILLFRNDGLGRARLPLSILPALIALATRAEIALLAPALLLLAYLRGGRPLLLRALTLAVAAGVLMLLLLLILGSGETARGTPLAQYIGRYFEAFVRGAAVPRNLFWASLGIGVMNLLLCASLWWRRLRTHRGESDSAAWRELAAPSLAALTVLLFWITNSVPLVRHFYLMLPAMAWMIGRGFFARSRATTWLLVAIALNLLLPELIYAGLERRGDARIAHGSFFSAHASQVAKVRRAREFASSAARRLDERQLDAANSTEGTRVVMPVNWTLYGYLEHELIVRGVRLLETGAERLDAGLSVKDFVAGSLRLRQIRTNWSGEPAIAAALRSAVTRSLEEGWELWLPHEFAAALEEAELASGRSTRL